MSQKGWIPKLSLREALPEEKKALESEIMFILYIRSRSRKQKVKRRPGGTFDHPGQQRTRVVAEPDELHQDESALLLFSRKWRESLQQTQPPS